MRRLAGLSITSAAILLLAVGCGKKQAALPPPLPPLVDVANPTLRYVTEYEYFTGRTEASETVEIRSRVSGYLDVAPVSRSEAKNGEVKEGDDVEKGRLLFAIDDRSFVAEKERAEANIRLYEAQARRLESDYRSAVRSREATTQQEVVRITAELDQAKANVKSSTAALRVANINLGYTKIAAPFSGRISRRYVDPGNLVKADDTILTTIVRLDPIHAYFDIDERTVLRFRDMLTQKEIVSARKTPLKVKLALAHEADYRRDGVIDFIDNHLEPGTGTLRIRVETANPKSGDLYYLSPGMFIRLRLPVGKERQALLVPEKALASKQGEKVIYVVRSEEQTDEQGNVRTVERVHEVRVVPGQLEGDWRVVKRSGLPDQWPQDGKDLPEALREQVLQPNDRIVVSGLQRVRDKGEVRLVSKKEGAKPVAQKK